MNLGSLKIEYYYFRYKIEKKRKIKIYSCSNCNQFQNGNIPFTGRHLNGAVWWPETNRISERWVNNSTRIDLTLTKWYIKNRTENWLSQVWQEDGVRFTVHMQQVGYVVLHVRHIVYFVCFIFRSVCSSIGQHTNQVHLQTLTIRQPYPWPPLILMKSVGVFVNNNRLYCSRLIYFTKSHLNEKNSINE